VTCFRPTCHKAPQANLCKALHMHLPWWGKASVAFSVTHACNRRGSTVGSPPALFCSSAAEKDITDRTPRQTQAGIGHSAHTHRGGQFQNRIQRRQALQGKVRPLRTSWLPWRCGSSLSSSGLQLGTRGGTAGL